LCLSVVALEKILVDSCYPKLSALRCAMFYAIEKHTALLLYSTTALFKFWYADRAE